MMERNWGAEEDRDSDEEEIFEEYKRASLDSYLQQQQQQQQQQEYLMQRAAHQLQQQQQQQLPGFTMASSQSASFQPPPYIIGSLPAAHHLPGGGIQQVNPNDLFLTMPAATNTAPNPYPLPPASPAPLGMGAAGTQHQHERHLQQQQQLEMNRHNLLQATLREQQRTQSIIETNLLQRSADLSSIYVAGRTGGGSAGGIGGYGGRASLFSAAAGRLPAPPTVLGGYASASPYASLQQQLSLSSTSAPAHETGSPSSYAFSQAFFRQQRHSQQLGVGGAAAGGRGSPQAQQMHASSPRTSLKSPPSAEGSHRASPPPPAAEAATTGGDDSDTASLKRSAVSAASAAAVAAARETAILIAGGPDRPRSDPSPTSQKHEVLPMTSALGPDVKFLAKKRRAYKHQSFPEKLYQLIEDAEKEGKDHIVSFIPAGTAILIHKPDLFEKEIIPKYFRHKKLESFRRQFSMYGFQRLKKDGPYKGAYHHQLFVRGKPELLTKIKRVSEMDIVLPPGAGPPQDK